MHHFVCFIPAADPPGHPGQAIEGGRGKQRSSSSGSVQFNSELAVHPRPSSSAGPGAVHVQGGPTAGHLSAGELKPSTCAGRGDAAPHYQPEPLLAVLCWQRDLHQA